MKRIELDLTDLRLLTEAFLAACPPPESKEGELAQMDPLLEKILNQAQTQIEHPVYTLSLEDEEAERLSEALTCVLEDISEEGDLLMIGHLGELLSRLD